jgi:hypothetical protein
LYIKPAITDLKGVSSTFLSIWIKKQVLAVESALKVKVK